jgi:hypothetical protein
LDRFGGEHRGSEPGKNKSEQNFHRGAIIPISGLGVERATLQRDSCEKKILLFCLLESFPYERIGFSRCHHEWKNNFLLLTQSRLIELALLSGPLPLNLESNDLERRTS